MGFLDKLFKPAWQHKDSNVRLNAVKKLNDSKKLGLVAKNDSDYKVRIAAINNPYFKDEEILNYILEHDGYHVLKKRYLNGMHNTYSYHIFPVRDAASRKLKELRNK